MSEDSKSSLALNRILRLCNTAANHSYEYASDSGIWNHADYDELKLLVKFLEPNLRSQLEIVLPNRFPDDSAGQEQTAQRVLRAKKMFSEYGVPDEISDTPEALEPTFELNKKDQARVLELAQKMRKIVLATSAFDHAHKRRLLDRITAIEKQVHQPKGRLDVILGGVSDVGDTLKKFGTDLKPLTDRMTEIKKITQSHSGEYEAIPAPEEIKGLPAPEEGED
jgi:hypothetical protein